jgi:hypothetical protein
MALEMGESRFTVLFLFFMSGMKRLIMKECSVWTSPSLLCFIFDLHKYKLSKRDSLAKLNKSFLISNKASPPPPLLRRQDDAQDREFAANCSPGPT